MRRLTAADKYIQITGEALAAMTDKELRGLIADIGLFATKEAVRPKLLNMVLDAASDIINK